MDEIIARRPSRSTCQPGRGISDNSEGDQVEVWLGPSRRCLVKQQFIAESDAICIAYVRCFRPPTHVGAWLSAELVDHGLALPTLGLPSHTLHAPKHVRTTSVRQNAVHAPFTAQTTGTSLSLE